MKQYLNLVQDILDNGNPRLDRTGVGTYAVFGRQMRFDLQDGLPLITTKKVFTKAAIAELIWFLEGSTSIHRLKELGATFWDPWASPEGDIGPLYGAMWRSWPTQVEGKTIDQIANAVELLKNDPFNRRIIVDSWNPEFLPEKGLSPSENAEKGLMSLAPCHCLFQFFVTEEEDSDGVKKKRLHCQLYQRSVDVMIGLPVNIVSYAILTAMMAQVCGLERGEFVWTGGDTHIYSYHLDGAKKQLTREPKELPNLFLNPDVDSLFDFKPEDIEIEGYDPHPHIKLPVAV